MQGGKSWQRTLAHLVSTTLKSSTSCVISQECSMALCLLAPFGKDQKNARQPLAAPARNPPCVARCVGQACGLVWEKPSGAKHRLFLTEKRRVSPPVRPVVADLDPRWGNDPSPPVPGRFGPHRGQFGRKKRKAPQGPVWQKEKKTPTTPGLGRIWGCDSQAGERPGVAGASPAGSPRPAEPVVAGFLPSSTTKKIRGRLGGLGVTTRVRNRKFPGGKPFLRVSPPGSTKG